MLRRSLIAVHRWLGVALALPFIVWFLSGFVMLYRTFPEVTPADRLQRAPILDTARAAVPVDRAVAASGVAGVPDAVVLASLDGRPVYRIVRDGVTAVVRADDGLLLTHADPTLIDRVAAGWSGQPASLARKESIDVVDQWTVGGVFRRHGPLVRYSWPDGQQVYVDRSGTVAQHTTTASRLWAYAGAIPHWLYFTPLRRHSAAWSVLVIWLSALGTVSAVLGLVVGVWAFSPRKRYRIGRVSGRLPYTRWRWLHAVLGLTFGIAAVTWVFSGMLSMGPFPAVEKLTEMLRSRPTTPEGVSPAELAAALRGPSPGLAAFAHMTPAEVVAAVPDVDVREIEFTSFDGSPLFLVRARDGSTRLVPPSGTPHVTLEADAVTAVLRRATGQAPLDATVIRAYDTYYRDRRGERPLPVVRAHLGDGLVYVDLASGRVVGTYSHRQWVERWLYQGLHSLDFPWFAERGPGWNAVALILLAGGTVLSLSAIVLAWRIVRRRPWPYPGR